MGEELNGTLHLLWEDGTLVPFTGIGEVSFTLDSDQRIIEMHEVRRIVREICDQEDLKARVRVEESSRLEPSVRFCDGSEDEAALIWPSHLSFGDDVTRAIKTVLGLYFKPTPRNFELFCLLHELGHVRVVENMGYYQCWYYSIKRNKKWWLKKDCFLQKFAWTRYLVQLAYMLLPLERQATKYALKWMKEMGL